MGAFDERADAFGVASQLSEGERVADGGNIGVVHRFVGLGLDGEPGALVVGEHFIESLDEILDAAGSALGFADVGAFAREPEDDEVGAENFGDVNGAKGAVNGVLAMFGIVAGVRAVNGVGAEPETRGDHFGGDAFASEPLFQLAGFFADLRLGFGVNVRDGVVVVEHHGVDAEFFELGEFPIERLRGPGGGAVGVPTFADVPGAETKLVILRHKSEEANGVAEKRKLKNRSLEEFFGIE